MVNTGSKPSTLTFHQGKTLIKPTFSKQSPHRRWRVKTAEAASAFATPRLLGFNNPTFVGYARYFTSTVGKVVRLTKKWTLQSRIMLLKYLLFNRKSAHTVTEWDTGYTLDITGHTPFPPSLSLYHTHTPGHTPRGNFESLNNLRWACSLLWEKTRVPFFFFKSRGKGNFREKTSDCLILRVFFLFLIDDFYLLLLEWAADGHMMSETSSHGGMEAGWSFF